jgi:simple sugar transport system ATP-binding protein
MPTAELGRRRAALERAVGITLPPLGTPVRALSVGERQWLEVARALLAAPRLLLLDEPTAVLTPGEAEGLFATVRTLRQRGAAVLFITHRLDEVRRVADRVLVLRRGRLVAELEPQAAASELAAAMTGEEPPVPERPERALGPVVARLLGVSAPPRLQSLDLELRAGEVVALAGVDGNGQVEAAARLAGLSGGPGVVEIGGRRVRRPDPGAMRRLGVAVIPADRAREGVVPSLSVAENLVLGTPLPFPLRPSQLWQRAAEMIERYALVGRPDQSAGELSGGNQQKLVVARALEGRPPVVVAMHPTRGLDLNAQVAVRRLLLEAAAEGSAVLVVTADLDEARELGDRILVLSRGRVVGCGDRTTPFTTLARWIGGEVA